MVESFRHALSSGGPVETVQRLSQAVYDAADKTSEQRCQDAGDRCRDQAIEDQGSGEGNCCTDLSDWAC